MVFGLSIDQFITDENADRSVLDILLDEVEAMTGERLTPAEFYKQILHQIEANYAEDHILIDDVHIAVTTYLIGLGIWIEAEWLVDSVPI